MKINWDLIKCPKCNGKKFFGKYMDKPYCLDCGSYFEVKKLNEDKK